MTSTAHVSCHSQPFRTHVCYQVVVLYFHVCVDLMVLAVDFRQPRTLVMLWFELHFGTNPPLDILMI
jgi:hypothetical protein